MELELGWVISLLGSAAALIAIAFVFREIGRHEGHVSADPELVTRLVQSAPHDWLKNLITKA